MASTKEYNIKINGIKENVDGVKSLKDQTTDYSKSIKDINKEIKRLQGQMLGLEKGSEEWTKLAKKTGELRDRVNDIREATRRYASDTKALDDVINVAQSATAAFTLAKGAMSAFGLETEGAVEAIQKLQGAMAVIQSLQTLQNTLKGSTATATLYTKAMNLLSMAMGNGSTASKVLRGAMLAIPLMLVITAVTELVMHWDELVGWFTKTFPALKNLSTWFDKVKGAVSGLGNAVWEAIKSFTSLGEVIGAIFSGEWDKAAEIAKNAWNNITQGFKTGYANKMAAIQEEVTLKELEENNKRTKHNLEMLKAQKGNAAKYSKEGIALQKKDFEQRKKLAKGNKDELNKIALEEANFYRECQENKSKAAQKAAKDAAAAQKKADDERKKTEEKAKEAAKKANDKIYESQLEMELKYLELDIKKAEEEVKKFESGPAEEYKNAMYKLKEAQEALVEKQSQQKGYSMFKDYRDNISGATSNLNDFNLSMRALIQFVEVFKSSLKDGEVLTVDMFKEATSSIDEFKNLSETDIKYLYGIYMNYVTTALDESSKKAIDNSKAVAQQLLNISKKNVDNITAQISQITSRAPEAFKGASLIDAIFKPSKVKESVQKYKNGWKEVENTIKGKIDTLTAAWDAYLANVLVVYGKDSKEYIEACDQKIEALKKLLELQKQAEKNQQTPGSGDKKKQGGNQFQDFDANGGIDWGSVKKTIEDAYDAFVDPIVGGITDTIGMMLEVAIEEAEAALEEAEEIHDKAVEKVESSKSRLSEINTEMADASASRLEQLKSQQADEMLLLAQREAEEKRAEREKERREKELEKKKKQQRKMELQVQMVEALASGALAAINGFATKPFVPVGLAMGALATTLTAVQLGVMAKQMSKLADGGLLQGPSHSQGGIPVGNTGIEVEGGEYVVNARSTRKYLPLLQQLNAEGARKKTVANQIGKFANGGQINYERVSSNLATQDVTKVIQSSIGSIDFQPVVSVVDINRGQKNLVNVRQIAGASK